MDVTKLENKAKPMKKRSVQLVHEHFEEVLTQLSGFVTSMQGSQPSRPSIRGLSHIDVYTTAKITNDNTHNQPDT